MTGDTNRSAVAKGVPGRLFASSGHADRAVSVDINVSYLPGREGEALAWLRERVVDVEGLLRKAERWAVGAEEAIIESGPLAAAALNSGSSETVTSLAEVAFRAAEVSAQTSLAFAAAAQARIAQEGARL